MSIGYAAVQRLPAAAAGTDSARHWPYRSSKSLINPGVALVLMRGQAAPLHHAGGADAHHLLTDVWTSVGVLVGVGLVADGVVVADPWWRCWWRPTSSGRGVGILRRLSPG
ncbi:MAG: hypothetical protein R2854_26245 [Caldilineaceae bacterium]